jgi:hypothetical protein
MGLLNSWIDEKLGEIANKLPSLVHTEPASFACGYNVGYKQALLDIENHLDALFESIKSPNTLQELYQTSEQIIEAMQW